MIQEPWRLDATALAEAIRNGRLTSRDAVESCLSRLHTVNPRINAVTVTLADEARAAADEADAALRRGEALGPLHGVPVAIKENVDQARTATTAGVAAFRDMMAPDDSAPVANWRRSGAVIVGRTNTSPFAMRWHTDNELRGATLNPWDTSLTPGGSSGGAAAALAAGIVPLAHGNDYGGSIRWPAYCCGVTGLRPTFGRIPSFNPSAKEDRGFTSQTFAVQGPMARSVRDLRLGLAAMCGRDPRDPWWVPAPLEGPAPASPLKVALAIDPGGQGVAPAVAHAVRKAGRALERAGYVVEEVDPPSVELAADLWWRLAWTETRHVVAPAIERFGDDALRQTTARYMASAPDIDLAGYMKDIARRATCLREWMVFLERYAVVVGPVSTQPVPGAAFDIADGADALEQKKAFRLLISVNLLGLPAVSVPTGVEGNVPCGVQVIGSRFREDLCLAAAEAIEANCGVFTPIDLAR
ncbi:MAG TPA: amidase [Ramlibacter sp.]|uniref:amidase n=1 Tax=Ramlibacter sp. TaxID=1917967 RepID=UPI002CCC5659|nr:amidase [Ramlibacter sp.]HVZ46610.1 amidase [Ramlibacter sp.]